MILPGEMEKEIRKVREDLEALKRSHENYIKFCISLQKEVGEIRKELSSKKGK